MHIQLSSSGLIYRHYGREIIQAFAAEAKVELDSELLEDIYARLYGGFIEHVDAIDNGISVGEDLKYNIRCKIACLLCMHTYILACIQTDRQAGKQTDRQTYIQTCIHTIAYHTIA